MADKTLVCSDCSMEFAFTEREQAFYAEKGFTEPRRCPSCRASRKAARSAESGGGLRRFRVRRLWSPWGLLRRRLRQWRWWRRWRRVFVRWWRLRQPRSGAPRDVHGNLFELRQRGTCPVPPDERQARVLLGLLPLDARRLTHYARRTGRGFGRGPFLIPWPRAGGSWDEARRRPTARCHRHGHDGTVSTEDALNAGRAAPILALDIGGTKLAAGVVDPDGTVRSFLVTPSLRDQGPDAMIARLIALGRDALTEVGLPIQAIAAVGISCGGPLDTRTGVIQEPPNLPGWRDVPLTDTSPMPWTCRHSSTTTRRRRRWPSGAGVPARVGSTSCT